jgi:hypothetical protein
MRWAEWICSWPGKVLWRFRETCCHHNHRVNLPCDDSAYSSVTSGRFRQTTRVAISQKTAIATLDGSFKHIYITHCRNCTNLRLSEWRNGGVAPRSLNIRSECSWGKYLKHFTALLVLGAFGKLQKVATSFCRSFLAHTYRKTRPPLDGFS